MIKLPAVHIGKLNLLLSVLVWLALLFVDLIRLFGILNDLNAGIAEEFTWILEILFFLAVYFFYKHSLQQNAQNDFVNLLWRAASTGIFAAATFLLIQGFYFFLGDSKLAEEPFLRNFFYHVHFAMITVFLISSTLLWKKLILYQKSKGVIQQWKTYEIGLLVSMLFVFYTQDNFGYSFIFAFLILAGFGIFLSVNLKWIPYLTFREKWKSLLFLALIIVVSIYLFLQTGAYSRQLQTFPINLLDNLFLIALYAFVLSYALVSFLVTLFNLPTSSVFEQKLTEAINFQRLSQSIQPEENEEKVLDILLDSSMSAAYADAGWLELFSEEPESRLIEQRWIATEDLRKLSATIGELDVVKSWKSTVNQQEISPLTIRVETSRFGSILLVPLVVNKKVIGKMILCKEIKDGFTKEMISIVNTFSGQANIAVENHRLLNQAIQNERYQEELKIAQRVQKSLLPELLDHHSSFDISAFSNAADEVGGDYYDTFQLDEHRYALIIGDVSGKGTSAAFHMAQMKGVFQSLIQMDLRPGEFLIRSNAALSRCLERNHFITGSILIIDTAARQICHARAGHVPTILYQSTEQKARFLEISGLGLGILRNKDYQNHVEEKEFGYQSGDVIGLFTDGIVEAKNHLKEQFGLDRIKAELESNASLDPTTIQQKLIASVHEFVGGTGHIDDDYSLMIVKFN